MSERGRSRAERSVVLCVRKRDCAGGRSGATGPSFTENERLEYVYRLEEGSREAEGESDGGTSQRKQVGRGRRD